MGTKDYSIVFYLYGWHMVHTYTAVSVDDVKEHVRKVHAIRKDISSAEIYDDESGILVAEIRNENYLQS